MTKTEIIHDVAYINVPDGSQLVEESNSEGLRVAFFNVSQTERGGWKIVEARLFETALTGSFSPRECEEVPDSAFFKKLHECIFVFRDNMLDALTIVDLEAEIIREHEKAIAKLRGIARELQIQYTEPKDRT